MSGRMFVKTHSEILEFHTEIERIAKMMCEEMGLNPLEVIEISYGSDWTAFESACGGIKEHLYNARSQPVIHVERWRSFRPQAALELAGFRALHKYILTET
jgi:hypothetical protein